MCRIKEIKEFSVSVSVSFSLPAIVQKHQRQGTNHHPLIKILHHIIELPIGKRTAERRIQLQSAIDDIPNTEAFGRIHAKIKAITGQTPNDFFITLRLKKAAFLLRNNPELNITEISDRIGFSSSRYFSKCFKEIYHVSPLAYRKGEEKEEEGNEETDQ